MNFVNLARVLVYAIMLISLALLVLLLFSYQDNSEIHLVKDGENKNCISPKDVDSLEYDACYDAFSGSLYFEIKNDEFVSKDTKVRLRFFDYLQKSFDIDIPEYGSSSFKKFPAGRNPLSVEVYLDDPKKEYCDFPIDLKTDYCPANLSAEEDVSFSLISDVSTGEFDEVLEEESDKFGSMIVNQEAIWENVCQSDWSCGDWGDCMDGVQKRQCDDLNDCKIPTNVPRQVRPCGSECIEDWDCVWSECVDGYTTPKCRDLNNCGTTINLPEKISCEGSCNPDIECGDWSSCQATYNFLTLKNGDYSLSGEKSRTCTDKNGCVRETVEHKECLLVIDVYTRSFSKCGKDYIGIYNKLDNALLANIEKGDNKDTVNIDLTGESSKFYCDHCFNGILDGDETEIDCGGSCRPCQERRIYPDYSQNVFDRILDSFLSFMG